MTGLSFDPSLICSPGLPPEGPERDWAIANGYLREVSPGSELEPASPLPRVSAPPLRRRPLSDAEMHRLKLLSESIPAEGVEWKLNQLCWCCEERRKCRRELPPHQSKWVCQECIDRSDAAIEPVCYLCGGPCDAPGDICPTCAEAEVDA